MNGRVIICGMISEYNSPQKVGARNVWQRLVKRILGANPAKFQILQAAVDEALAARS